MQLKISVTLDDATFERIDGKRMVAEMLRAIAMRVEYGDYEPLDTHLYDAKGDIVGHFTVSQERPGCVCDVCNHRRDVAFCDACGCRNEAVR